MNASIDITRESLLQLEDVLNSLQRHSIRYAIFGGYGVVFHIGRLHRLPADLDIAIPREDQSAILSLFEREERFTYKIGKRGTHLDFHKNLANSLFEVHVVVDVLRNIEPPCEYPMREIICTRTLSRSADFLNERTEARVVSLEDLLVTKLLAPATQKGVFDLEVLLELNPFDLSYLQSRLALSRPLSSAISQRIRNYLQMAPQLQQSEPIVRINTLTANMKQ
jgi:hypothetical protein